MAQYLVLHLGAYPASQLLEYHGLTATVKIVDADSEDDAIKVATKVFADYSTVGACLAMKAPLDGFHHREASGARLREPRPEVPEAPTEPVTTPPEDVPPGPGTKPRPGIDEPQDWWPEEARQASQSNSG